MGTVLKLRRQGVKFLNRRSQLMKSAPPPPDEGWSKPARRQGRRDGGDDSAGRVPKPLITARHRILGNGMPSLLIFLGIIHGNGMECMARLSIPIFRCRTKRASENGMYGWPFHSLSKAEPNAQSMVTEHGVGSPAIHSPVLAFVWECSSSVDCLPFHLPAM